MSRARARQHQAVSAMSMRSTQGPLVASRAPTGVVGIAGTAHGPAIDIKPQFLAPTGVFFYDPKLLSHDAASLQSSLQFAIDQKESMEGLLQKIHAYPSRSDYVEREMIRTINDITLLKFHIHTLWGRLKALLEDPIAEAVRAALGYVPLTEDELDRVKESASDIRWRRRPAGP